MALKLPRRAVIGAALLAVTISIVCVRLGFWQLDRLEQRRDLNAAISEGSAAREVEMDAALLDSIAADPSLFAYRSVRVTGTFEPVQFLLRGRALSGRPGVHLFTPLRLEDGELLLVNRGWLPSPDAATADPRPYLLSGVQTLQGKLEPLADGSADVVRAEVPLPGYPISSYLRLDRSALATDLGENPVAVYLQLSQRPPDAAEFPVPIPPPELSEGPHLGYAIQWFSFAAISLGGFLLVAMRSRRNG